MEKTDAAMEERYISAVNAYKNVLKPEEYLPLKEIFSELGDYKDAAAYRQKCENFLAYQVGSKVAFGTYRGKDVVWRVLQREGNRCLLLAEKPVDYRCFHDERDDTTWNNCSLRRWLNKQFLEETFTLQERMTITLSAHQNGADPRWMGENGPDTRDKAFIFNLQELDEYLPNLEDRGIGEWWWLRGHGCSNLNQQAVYKDGTIYENGVSSNSPDVGVRPAMWVHLKTF